MTLKKNKFVIAVDGPAGTGKSSVTKILSERLGFVHIDTGALYRSLAYLCLEQPDVDPAKLAHETHFEFRFISDLNPPNRIFVNGRDVTPFIRTPQVSLAASNVSIIPEVRAALLGLQRRLGCLHDSILEGRDIGTVIFPDADVKFFLTASVEERAKRRLLELQASGNNNITLDEIIEQTKLRDHQDSTRAIAPLKQAEDAILIDTTRLTLEEVVGKMEDIVRKKIGLHTNEVS
jgi:cytidylate kinase